MWDQEQQAFVVTPLYRVPIVELGMAGTAKITAWLANTYGRAQQHDSSRYWSVAFSDIIMSEKVYLFYLMKWDGQL